MKQTGNARLIGVIVIIGIFVFAFANSGNGGQFSSADYNSAFQGPKISFYGESYSGKQYTESSTSSLSFSPSRYMPIVNGEMTTCFLPASSANYAGALGMSIPTSWTQNLDLFACFPGWTGTNPMATYNWNISDTSGTPLMVVMSQYEQKFYVSFATQWDSAGNNDPATKLVYPFITHAENTYSNLIIWFKVDTTPTWYITEDSTAFCAIASMILGDDVQLTGKTNTGTAVTARSSLNVQPPSQQATITLYANPFGGNQISDQTPEMYEGHLLNPAYFRSESYFSINLANFGNYADSTGIMSSVTKGDVVTLCFDVTVFVFGQYTVQDIQENPDQFGEFTPVSTIDSVFGGLLNWLASPVNISLLVIIAIVVLLILFAPWVLLVIVSLFTGGRKKG